MSKDAKTYAFALAGLGGFNAHGAGFLKAATECGAAPDLVTATSGQIMVLANWLEFQDPERGLVDPTLENNPLGQLAVAFTGYPNVFRPAYLEALGRWFNPFSGGRTNAFDALSDRLLPAQAYVPVRSDQEFKHVADVLNDKAAVGDKQIGVVFNAYDVRSGKAVLYGNDAARALWPPSNKFKQDISKDGRLLKQPPDLKPITADAVKSALWLSLYGFDDLPYGGRIDGAYDRACIVSDLHVFDQIYVARPLANGWLEKRPRNYFEVQDWQTEMWFSVGYKAEVDALHKINELVAKHGLKGFKQVELYEVAPKTPAGYFNYFVERDDVAEQAFKDAMEVFKAHPPGGVAG